MSTTQTRGERNNNPGNIRHGDKWRGMADDQPDASFIKFKTPEYGIRAIAITLLTYYNRYGLNTVRAIVSRWAPPNENNTESYINAVAKSVGVQSQDHIDVTDSLTMKHLVCSIIQHENGRISYSNDQIREGLSLAGIN
jgi:hypothetical protein